MASALGVSGDTDDSSGVFSRHKNEKEATTWSEDPSPPLRWLTRCGLRWNVEYADPLHCTPTFDVYELRCWYIRAKHTEEGEEREISMAMIIIYTGRMSWGNFLSQICDIFIPLPYPRFFRQEGSKKVPGWQGTKKSNESKDMEREGRINLFLIGTQEVTINHV